MKSGISGTVGEVLSEFEQGVIPSDRKFDRLLSPGLRSRSEVHWTPVRVANMVAHFIAPSEHSRVLDVGSGCGKFCVVGALSSPGRFYGVEEKLPLHFAAQGLAKDFELDRAHFIHGDAFALSWNEYSALYFYNPFGEKLVRKRALDRELTLLTPRQYNLMVGLTVQKLEGLPRGVKVAAYHGFGGFFPRSFQCVHNLNVGSGAIEVWVKE